MTNKEIKQLYNELKDSEDLWGSVMAFSFALCDYIKDQGKKVPEYMEFKQSSIGPDKEDSTFQYISSYNLKIKDILNFMPVIDRYTKMLAINKDY